MKFISLFSGAMGLDLGLEMAGFEVAVCVENDKEVMRTIKHNRPELPCFGCSIVDVSGEDLKEAAKFGQTIVPLVAGGPPCQAFSSFGNRLGIEDTRGQLVFEFMRIVEEIQPATFLMENVRGLLSMPIVPSKKGIKENPEIPPECFEKGSLLNKIFEDFNKLGYHVDCFVVNSVNYGAPQIRERVLLIGNRYGYQTMFPGPGFSNRPEDNLPPFRTLGDAISPDAGFIDPYPEVMNFSPRKLRYLSMVPEGGNWRSLPVEVQKEAMGKALYQKGGRSSYWRKLSYAFPSPTVVSMPNHRGTSMCHPKDLRAISVGEAAAIQEFPVGWEFEGTTSAKFKQVGNAVPTRLGKVAGLVIKDLLMKIEREGRAEGARCSHTLTHLRPHVRTRTFWRDGESFSGDNDYYEKKPDNEGKQLELTKGIER